MRQTILNFLCAAALLASSGSHTVSITVQDGSGEALKDELIIIKDLNNHERELARRLTLADGSAGPLELPARLYRVIADNSYGLWMTTVREFAVNESPVELVLKVDPKPTEGAGDIVVASKRIGQALRTNIGGAASCRRGSSDKRLPRHTGD